MKLSAMVCAVVGLSAMALGVEGAFAATTINTTKSNTFKLDAGDANADTVCTSLGGTVAVEKDGTKVCTLPAAMATTVKGSKSNSSERTTTINNSKSNNLKLAPTDTNKSCTDKGGAVFTASDGQRFCVFPAPAAKPPATP